MSVAASESVSACCGCSAAWWCRPPARCCLAARSRTLCKNSHSCIKHEVGHAMARVLRNAWSKPVERWPPSRTFGGVWTAVASKACSSVHSVGNSMAQSTASAHDLRHQSLADFRHCHCRCRCQVAGASSVATRCQISHRSHR